MNAVRTIRNQYQGINAHLHSLFQAEGGWDGFHANHIADLMRLMSAQLLPMGYVADIQQSLQIRRFGEPAGKPESEVTIYDRRPGQRPARSAALLPGQALAITDVMSLEREFAEYSAVAIYTLEAGKRAAGEPVAWVELLSPSNKPGGQDASYYRDKRWKLLHSGIVFVEIDYLHESAPTFDGIARYASPAETGAQPYHIFVVDPRPAVDNGLIYPNGFGVDMHIPMVSIPLNAGDVLTFDFNAAYNKTYAETLYGVRLVDYAQLPLNFNRYSDADQLRILARMLAVLRAARDGVNLEQVDPLPTETVSYDDALKQIAVWK